MISSIRWRIILFAAALAVGTGLFFIQRDAPSRNRSTAPLQAEQSSATSQVTIATNSIPQSDPAVSTVDFAAALDAALSEADPRKRSQIFGTLLRQWFTQN